MLLHVRLTLVTRVKLKQSLVLLKLECPIHNTFINISSVWVVS